MPCDTLPAVSLLADLDAFFTDHHDCGDLDAGVDWPIVWIACECGPGWRGEGRRRPRLSWNARGRRLRAALAALLVHDQAAELRRMHGGSTGRHLDTRHVRTMI
jgi:hypothetical protein